MSRTVQDDQERLTYKDGREYVFEPPNGAAGSAMRRVFRFIAGSGNKWTKQRMITVQNFNLIYAYLPTLKPPAWRRAVKTLQNLQEQIATET